MKAWFSKGRKEWMLLVPMSDVRNLCNGNESKCDFLSRAEGAVTLKRMKVGTKLPPNTADEMKQAHVLKVRQQQRDHV